MNNKNKIAKTGSNLGKYLSEINIESYDLLNIEFMFLLRYPLFVIL